ncbi:hypothetical protein B0H14DRAFT_2636078 [Mycena olivaceomarginata]|nr:hypothetical protein B0H14DRAFT_2636078 [Mycena olivaceomarginata]
MGTDAKFVVEKSKEHVDSRDAGDRYYLDREKVNEWSKHHIAEMLLMEAVEDITAKMWGIFDETGIFLCLCCHRFVLVICDIIKGGELSKYPLAVINCLIEHLGQSIGNGYDIGCDFQTTIKKSPLAARAAQCNFRCLVGTFHAHAHNQLCQLRNLATYVLGLGCEDLEGSNSLAKSCRYTSRFHRQQEITAYMDKEDITSFNTFRIWLEEEKEFSTRSESRLEGPDRDFGDGICPKVEIKQKKYQKALDAVELLVVEQIFELTKMNQSQTGRCFQGYKLRKHIGKALQARSKAVRNAIDQYNDAAMALYPPMPSLTWEQAVEYTFLADFDILQDTRVEVQSRPWTQPAYWLSMDTYFKIKRAKEEITRLNIEIRQLVTWIRDEGRFLRDREAALRSSEGKTEEQAEADFFWRQQRSRFDDQHMEILRKLAKMKGFTGNLSPGQVVEALGGSEEMEEMEVDDDREAEAAQADSDQSEDEGIEAQDETCFNA